MNLGAQAIERDYSHYVAYAAKTILAVVGVATKGPVGEAVVCTTSQDLINKFGPLTPESYALYAGQYFLSQSSKLYFVRAASENAAKSKARITGLNISDNEVADAITLESTYVGTYADGMKLEVTVQNPEETTDAAILYTLTLKSKTGTTLLVLKNKLQGDLAVGFTTDYFSVSAISSSTAVQLKPGTYEFSGGNNGIEGIEAGDYINAAECLRADTVDMNLLAVPGVSEPAVVISMLSLVENRGDCLYIVDPPKGLTKDGVVQWHNGAGEYNHTAFNSSYGALYYDWVTIYDSVNKIKVDVPPSVVVAATIAYSDRVTEPWYAPAGLQRGIIRGVLDSVTKLTKPDTDYLYSDDNSINSLYDDPQVGLVLWGQKTLLRADTALNRINVRRLMNYLKRVITAACNYLTFEPNDRVTWNSFEMKVLPVLKNIKNKRGIYEYRVIKGETIVTNEDIDNYRMPCMVMIRPTKSAEEIPIYFVITSTGADFNEVLDANGVVVDI